MDKHLTWNEFWQLLNKPDLVPEPYQINMVALRKYLNCVSAMCSLAEKGLISLEFTKPESNEVMHLITVKWEADVEEVSSNDLAAWISFLTLNPSELLVADKGNYWMTGIIIYKPCGKK